MISFIVAVAVGGCHQQAFVAQQVSYVPAVYVQPLVQTYGVVDPYWTPRDNSAERIERLLQAVETQAATIEKLTASQPVKHCDDCEKDVPSNDSVSTQARAILERSCVTCHNGSNPDTDLDLTGTIAVEDRIKIVGEVALGKMPKQPADILPDDELAILTAWAHQDREAVRSLLRSK